MKDGLISPFGHLNSRSTIGLPAYWTVGLDSILLMGLAFLVPAFLFPTMLRAEDADNPPESVVRVDPSKLSQLEKDRLRDLLGSPPYSLSGVGQKKPKASLPEPRSFDERIMDLVRPYINPKSNHVIVFESVKQQPNTPDRIFRVELTDDGSLGGAAIRVDY